jgi:hypothetical protein
MTDTEWTSISVTEDQKQTLKDAKPDSASMGAWLVGAIDSNNKPEGKREILDEIHATLDRIEQAQSDTSNGASIDYAEIETRVKRAVEEVLHG